MSNDDGMVLDSLEDLMQLIEEGRIIPVVSNGFRIEQIFREDKELFALMAEVPEFYDKFRNFDQLLTKKWAASIDYPMSDDHNLARVAQYLQVEQTSLEGARKQYLGFLVDRLLKLGEKNEGQKELIAGIRKSPKMPLFSDVADRLEYPRFTEGFEDPLRLLAKLPIKVYLTTSYSNFLERALIAEDKEPHTQLCFCKVTNNKYRPDRDFIPSEKEPAVVHLFGLEDYPITLVLSEDDYINFLVNAVQNLNEDDVYPSYLRNALSTSNETSLLLLGYHLHDWDFRTLMGLIARLRHSKAMDTASIAIQFNPNLGRKENEERSLHYLKKYFGNRKIKVRWDSTESFIYELWNAWVEYGRAQL